MIVEAKDEEVLPEKCCAKCGFLYALAAHAATRDDAVFDPDLIRSTRYSLSGDSGFRPGIITSYPYVTRQMSFRPGRSIDEPVEEYEKVGTEHYSWVGTIVIGCYLKESSPITPQGGTWKDPPENWDEIKHAIQKDRRDCVGFFGYQPGHTPVQHVELRLEERRIQREEAHQRRLEEHESRWRRAERLFATLTILLTSAVLCIASVEACSTAIAVLVSLGVIKPLR